MARNVATYGVFAATERLLMEAVKAGGDRQELHEVIREHSLAAWDALRRGETNPFVEDLCGDEQILRWLPVEEVTALLDAGDYVGDVLQRALAMAELIPLALDGIVHPTIQLGILVLLWTNRDQELSHLRGGCFDCRWRGAQGGRETERRS